ncbi:MAG: protein-glutamate O-methyltransferase CheR [Clostridiales bacterium]|nr:protein-glutamate O-methyltransferase CheR [Clostridiales bacterium]
MITITENEFQKIARFVKENYGIHLKIEKISLVMGRLQSELSKKNFTSFSQYYDYVVNDETGRAANELIDRISTNHTYFMREKEHFRFFEEQVLPYFAEHKKENSLRLWSAGCSTGEEPYTLAMILSDFESKKKVWNETKILATDISEKVLTKAELGMYTSQSVSVLPSIWRLNYMSKCEEDKFKINDSIKNKILFTKFNLMDEFPFKRRFHTIFCRNVMIYFESKTRIALVNKFYNALETGGYLFIGQSESIIRNDSAFKYIMPSVYRKV